MKKNCGPKIQSVIHITLHQQICIIITDLTMYASCIIISPNMVTYECNGFPCPPIFDLVLAFWGKIFLKRAFRCPIVFGGQSILASMIIPEQLL